VIVLIKLVIVRNKKSDSSNIIGDSSYKISDSLYKISDSNLTKSYIYQRFSTLLNNKTMKHLKQYI
jgi:hypothetical protein